MIVKIHKKRFSFLYDCIKKGAVFRIQPLNILIKPYYFNDYPAFSGDG